MGGRSIHSRILGASRSTTARSIDSTSRRGAGPAARLAARPLIRSRPRCFGVGAALRATSTEFTPSSRVPPRHGIAAEG